MIWPASMTSKPLFIAYELQLVYHSASRRTAPFIAGPRVYMATSGANAQPWADEARQNIGRRARGGIGKFSGWAQANQQTGHWVAGSAR